MSTADMGAAPEAGIKEREEYEGRVRFFSEFLHANRDEWEKKVDTELANGRYRIPLQLRDLCKADTSLDRKVLQAPVKYLLPWEEALLSFLRETNEKAVKQLKQPLKLDIGGSFGRHHVTPRGLTGNSLQNLMCVEGVVIKAGGMMPKLLQSMHVHKNIDDGHVEQRDHRDQTAFVNQPAAGAMPTHDSEGNELMVEVGLSVYKDYQKFQLQESPENTPPGQIPRSVEVICEGDLAEKAKPGDRIQVIGVYRSFPPPPSDFTNGVFPARLIATSIQPLNELLEAPFVSDDVRNIREIAARTDAFKLLARSFAPSICGHEKVKEGLLLQMVGGTEKNLANGTHLRGDINVLLVGDPSCGKSQMLRFVMNIAPLAVSTTGRGSSGVGLTAAMTREPGSGNKGFTLEAGAMVRADRGVICIDEFDKMSIADRVAIHEAMEQQCVTIAKAGMHVTLNARCSVLAAANPIYGNFDPSLDLAKNIGLPDSLLSRFDLVFVVRDLTTEEIDRKIATQVLRQAQMRTGAESRRRGVEQIHSSILERRQEVDTRHTQEATEVFEKNLPGPDGEAAPEVLTVDFLRKYLRYCRRLTPVLSQGAQSQVADKYVDMRMRFSHGFGETGESKKPKLAVTTRTLEAIIRLATAHAKLKLRKDEVLEEDVDEAYRLLLSAREEAVPEPTAPNGAGEGGDGAPPPGGAGGHSQGKKRAREEDGALDDGTGSIAITSGRLATLTTLVARFLARHSEQEVPRDDLLLAVNTGLAEGEQVFVEEEFTAGLESLEAQNKIMVLETGNVINIG